MRYFAGFYGVPPPEIEPRSMGLLKSVGLEGSESMKIRTYSQGMKKRFSLAASMLGSPKNYLFDEVLNGLDPEGIRYFRRLMFDLRSQGCAVLLSSHILFEVESLADRVVVIHRGKVIKTIARGDLAAAGATVIRIVIKNLDDQALSYLRTLGDVRTEGSAVLLASDAEPSQVNAELLKRGYQVSEFAQQKEGLEDYFLNLIGEPK
jgi:ABC-2 type transport system ATP-binding protein